MGDLHLFANEERASSGWSHAERRRIRSAFAMTSPRSRRDARNIKTYTLVGDEATYVSPAAYVVDSGAATRAVQDPHLDGPPQPRRRQPSEAVEILVPRRTHAFCVDLLSTAGVRLPSTSTGTARYVRQRPRTFLQLSGEERRAAARDSAGPFWTWRSILQRAIGVAERAMAFADRRVSTRIALRQAVGRAGVVQQQIAAVRTR